MAGPGGGFGTEPERWLLVFTRGASPWWVRVLACGRFDHVFAVGRVRDLRAWVVYDVHLGGTTVAILPDGAGDDRLHELTAGGVVVVVEPLRRRTWFRPGHWCAPAMAHLVGLGFCWRPDTLYRKALRAGGCVVG